MRDAPTSLGLDAYLVGAGPSAASFARLWEALWRQNHISPELLELCRLTFARLHDDKAESAAFNSHLSGPTEERRRSVLAGTISRSPAFTEGEKAVLLFAEYYWLDTQSIPDEVADAVKAHFAEVGLVFLIQALGCIDGRIRTARCLRDLATHTAIEEFTHAA
jgi:hypothetical protein